MTLTTRKPTGLPSWPTILIAGREGTGKSWSAAQASASPLVGRTLWVGFGEIDPDEYAAIPGANFEIVQHDGTIRGLQNVLAEIARLPATAPPTLVVVDSGTRVWDTISENAQIAANQRAARNNRSGGAEDTPIGVDLWNLAKKDWQKILGSLRTHRGPTIITARFEEVAVIVKGKPTTDKVWKVKAEKGLPYDVDGVIEMQERGKFTLAKIKSVRMAMAKPRPWPGFTFDTLWRDMGLADSPVDVQSYADPVTDPAEVGGPNPAATAAWLADLAVAKTPAQVRAVGNAAHAVGADRSVMTAVRNRLTELTPGTPPAKQEGPTHGN